MSRFLFNNFQHDVLEKSPSDFSTHFIIVDAFFHGLYPDISASDISVDNIVYIFLVTAKYIFEK